MMLTHENNWHGFTMSVLATGTRSEAVGEKIKHEHKINYRVTRNTATMNTKYIILMLNAVLSMGRLL
jgi:hypothetical protein